MSDAREFETGSEESGDAAWDDIERAYQRALAALDALEPADAALAEDAGAVPSGPAPNGDGHSAPADPSDADADEAGGSPPASPVGGAARLTPQQILEAVLFVGGEPLTSRKLCGLFRDEFSPEAVDQILQDMNAQYADEERPYEIRLGEGGYRMELRAEFVRVRNRAFGLGPREVKLSQDALEVLALVAYHQPITKQQIEQAGKDSPAGVLGQLLRRELIALERTGTDGKQIAYRTAPRFLQLFGLTHLDELPQADELSFK